MGPLQSSTEKKCVALKDNALSIFTKTNQKKQLKAKQKGQKNKGYCRNQINSKQDTMEINKKVIQGDQCKC